MVFVVVVTYDGANWIDKCLSSLGSSMYSVRIVVVDNNSKDSTTKIIKENFPNLVLIESAENLGFGQANNIGIKYALENNADYVFLLNQDAWIESDTLETLIEFSSQNSDFGILSPMQLCGNGKDLDYLFSTYLPSKFNQNAEVIETDFINAAIWLITADCLEKVGGFDPLFFHYGEDVDYANRIRYHGYKIGVIANAIGYHDRKQETYESFSDEKKRTSILMGNLAVVKDINNKFMPKLVAVLVKSLRGIFGSLRRMNFKESAFYLRMIGFFVFNSFEIYRNRKISENKEAFL